MTAPFLQGPVFGFGRGSRGAIQTPDQLLNGPTVPTGRTLDIPLPEMFPIPDAREFNPLGTFGTTGAQTADVTGATVDIPVNMFAVIRSISVYITNMLTTTNVTWSLLINGAPATGYNGISIFPRNAPFVSNGFDSMIRIVGPATAKITFTNTDGGSYVVGAAFGGWFWPQASDQRWRDIGQ